jgi:hypothetical protein
MNGTVNEVMSLMKAVRERSNALKALRQQVAVKERWYGISNETQRATEPQYDIKAVDKKIMELENFLYKADAAVKQSNAKTKLELPGIDPDVLLAPLE